jgi:O-antigen/teichoic acid export membrane protein
VRNALICYTLSLLISGALGFALFTRGMRPTWRIDMTLAKPFFQFGIQAYLIFLFNYLNHRFDVFLVKHFLEATDVGLYQIAVGFSERMWQIPHAVSSVLYPTLLAMESGSGSFAARVCRNNFFVMLLLGGFLLGTGKWFIVLLYGDAYGASAPALYAILWGIAINPVGTMLGVYFTSRKELRTVIIASGIGFASNLAVNMYAIPRFGIAGAGAATSISYSVTALILATIFVQRKHGAWHDIFVVKRSDFASYRDGARKALARIRDFRQNRSGGPPDS